MPNTAITKNNAGIVQAIKRQSGSTKFYKPSFEGIIQAILDWQGGTSSDTGGGATVLPIGGTPPPTGNTEGDMVIIPNADGDYFIYVFADGAWENIHVTTEEVEVAGSAPLAITADDGTVLKNQKDVNEYLDEKIKELQDIELYDDSELRELIDALPVTVDDLAPIPSKEGDLWFDTTENDLQLFVNYGGQWVVASPPVSTDEIENSILEIQEILAQADALSIQRGNQIAALQSNIYNVAAGVVSIEEGLGKVTLQEVVDNGNTSDKPIAIETDKGVSVLEDQCMRITHQDNPYIRLVDEVDGDALEITLDDDSGHIDMSNESDALHFKFAGQEKVTIEGNGNAEFKGKVKVQPGEANNEAVTYGQLITLEEEIEQLRPTWDRGQWEYSPESYAQEKKYVLIQEFLEEDAQEDLCAQARADCMGDGSDPSVNSQCNREYDDCMTAIDGSKWLTTDDWEKVESIAFSKTSIDGIDHSFVDVEAGMMIDVFNVNDDGFMVASIDEKTTGPDGTGFKITLVQSRGKANGQATVKFFQLSEEGQNIELTNYVRKDGDTMTGPLASKALYPFRHKNPDGNNIIELYRSTDTMTALKVADGMSFKISSNNAQVFKIYSDGTLILNHLRDVKESDPSHSAVNKDYVDKEIARQLYEQRPPGPASLCWEYRKAAIDLTGPAKGCFYKCSKSYYRFSFQTANGVNLAALYPKDKNWNADNGQRFDLNFWEKTPANEWIFLRHVESASTRWGYLASEGGSTHFEFKDTWSSHGVTWTTGKLYYITAGGFF